MSRAKIQTTTQPTFKRCPDCRTAFASKFVTRTHCVKCKPTTKKELDSLMNFEGGKVVIGNPPGPLFTE